MYSYITLIANEDYLIGARALAQSLRMVNAKWPLTVMVLDHTLPVPAELAGDDVIWLSVDPLRFSAEFTARHSRESQHTNAPFTKGNKPDFHNPLYNFVKLRLWELTQFDRVIFLDADTLVIRNIDRLFAYPEFSGAPNLYESLADMNRLNSGVFVAQPNRSTFKAMLTTLDQPGAFWKRTDQTFLQQFFPDWHGLPYIFNTLQYIWFTMPELWNWDQISVIHYQYEKPWDSNNPKRDQLAPLIDLWWQVLNTAMLPDHLPEPATKVIINGIPAV